jgi:hypothetical protein
MQSALKVRTRVLPGKRVEVTAPELLEGEDVELIILKPDGAVTTEPPRQFKSVIEFIDSLKPVERTPEEWAAIEREFYEERNSWGD